MDKVPKISERTVYSNIYNLLLVWVDVEYKMASKYSRIYTRHPRFGLLSDLTHCNM